MADRWIKVYRCCGSSGYEFVASLEFANKIESFELPTAALPIRIVEEVAIRFVNAGESSTLFVESRIRSSSLEHFSSIIRLVFVLSETSEV